MLPSSKYLRFRNSEVFRSFQQSKLQREMYDCYLLIAVSLSSAMKTKPANSAAANLIQHFERYGKENRLCFDPSQCQKAVMIQEILTFLRLQPIIKGQQSASGPQPNYEK